MADDCPEEVEPGAGGPGAPDEGEPDCTCFEALGDILTANADANAQAIVDAINAQEDIEYLTVCDTDSGEWVHTIMVDGVATGTLATGTPCTEDPPAPPLDVEAVEECREGTLWNVWYTIDPANPGTQDEVAAVDTAIPCEQPSKLPERWCRRIDTIEVDNHTIGERPPGIVARPTNDQEWTVELSNGATHTCQYEAWDGTQPFVNQWAYINSMISRCLAEAAGKDVKVHPTGREYGTRGLDGNPSTPWGAYGWVDCCPGEVAPVAFTSRDLVNGRVISHLHYIDVGEVEHFTSCLDCEGNEEWRNADGEVIEKPEGCLFKDCNIPPAPTIPGAPAGSCTATDPIIVCEIQPGDDSDPDNVIDPIVITTGLFLNFITCGADTETEAFTLDEEGNQVLHELTPGNFYGDCDSLEPVGDPPPPACPEGAVFDCVEVSYHGVIADNNNWVGGSPTITGATTYVLEGELADGTTAQATGASWFPIRDVLQALGYSTQVVCANWPNCPPDGSQDVPWGIQPPIEELFARGWWGESCGSELVRLEVIEVVSGDTGLLGATRPLTIHEGPTETLYKSVNCDGVFWKDCDGNSITAPSCCGTPCGSGGMDIGEFAVECCSGETVEYANSDEATELDISVSGAGDVIKIGSGSGDGSDSEITAFIEECLAAGNPVDITWTTNTGATGEGTIDSQSTAFPGFSGPGSFTWEEGAQAAKLSAMTATCGGDCSLALQTAGCQDDRRDGKLDEIIGLLGQLVDCICCPDAVDLDRRCRSYSHPLTSGYANWSDTGDLDDLADEFGITPTAQEMWVRITEFDCGGTAQPQVGQIFGPYTPGPNGADQFITDLGAAISGTCLGVAPTAVGSGPNGIGSTIDYSYDSTQDSTLVFQEGVTVGAGVGWFTSAQGIVVRGGEAGDFISSTGNAATTNYASDALGDLDQYAQAEECGDL